MMRLGIAGIGRIAQHYIALLSAGAVTGVTVAALQSRRGEHAAAVAQQYGLTQAAIFTDYDDMLRRGALDAVLICTPHRLHPAMGISALEQGLHVLTDKPVGSEFSEAEALLAAAHAHPELTVGVLFNRRASAAYSHLHRLLRSGEVGELVRATWLITNHFRPHAYYAEDTWRGTWELEGGGLLMTQAAHQLDLFHWLCGEGEVVYARCETLDRPIETENAATLVLSFANGATGHFLASSYEQPGINRLELATTRGLLVLEDDTKLTFYRLPSDLAALSRSISEPLARSEWQLEQRTFPPEDDGLQHGATIQNFVDAAAGRASLLCPLEEGIQSLRTAKQAYAFSRVESKPR